ncbi:uncharacterized protein [Rutidosis leptorrhynchoides]|uniref:uncharacterized protein n=1 Tax=Rutidosis leptorrhynchoides TaxID=125765 RepID=UPI003A990728
MTNEEQNGNINDDIDIHDTKMVYQDDHEVNSEKELDYETEIDWDRNVDREFTQPDHEQAEADQQDQEEELVPTEQEIQNDVDSGSGILMNLVLSIQNLTFVEMLISRSFNLLQKKVKSWRNRLNELHYNPSKSRREQLRARPEVVPKKHWKRLVDFWNGDASKGMSEKNKRNRPKRSLHPLIGKKSYAQIREELKIQLGREPSRVDIFERSFEKADITNNSEAVKQLEQMKELSKELPEGSLDEPGPDDIYAQVRGTAKHGQAKMYGLGVRVSDVWGKVRSRDALCKENVKLKAELQEYKKREKQKNVMIDNTVVNPHASTNNGIITNTPLHVDKEVHLKSINNPTPIVAKGRLHSLDPLTVVGGIEIGPRWGEVHVQVAIKSDEIVIRPFELVTIMIEATGVAIAWPTSLLSVVPLD